MMPSTSLNTISWKDLYTTSGLKSFDDAFLCFLRNHHLSLYQDIVSWRALKNHPDNLQFSQFILDLAPWIEKFIVDFFKLDQAILQYQEQHTGAKAVAWGRKYFILKRVAHRYTALEAQNFNPQQLETVIGVVTNDTDFVCKLQKWLSKESQHQAELQAAIHYAAWAIYTDAGRNRHHHSVLFKIPEKLDYQELLARDVQDNISRSTNPQQQRSDFNHYAPCPSQTYAVREATYCLYCHHQQKDSCSQGLLDRQSKHVQCNSLSNVLTGCPLNQKISEMNQLYAEGHAIGALAAITLDNPLVAATGYRICNDCSKACIFQKQQPVDIPVIETRILQDVLAFPWGFEIYSLLTRWNPLNLQQPVPKASTGHRVLIVGLGPAGFTLAHYLLNQGHDVLAIDGQKIEPLTTDLLTNPIQDVKTLWQSLETRPIGGFGGVAEYGITSRWDKNNLTLIRLLLQRRSNFQGQGSTRFGSQMTQQSAFEAGFDHIALCTGAGKPIVLDIANRFAPGVYLASDFLMALHLQSFYRPEALASFDIKGPIVVIGGGLTAIDAATEALAYERCRQRQQKISQPTNAIVQIVYRKCLQEAPAYRLNHTEIQNALDQGVEFYEKSIPLEILIDSQGHVSGLKIKQEEAIKILPARTILIAVGTSSSSVDRSLLTLGNDVDTDQSRVSTFGDLTSTYAGSVVKAMASAKEGALQITQKMAYHALQQETKSRKNVHTQLPDLLSDLTASIVRIQQLIPRTYELVIHAPAAAHAFQPGQFFRLQNFTCSAPRLDDQALLMKGVALRGVWRDIKKGWLGFVMQDVGSSTHVASQLKVGEQVSLMGPVGQPIEILNRQKIILIGEGVGVTSLLSIGQAFADQSNDLLFIASYESLSEIIYQKHIQSVANQIIWCYRKSSSIEGVYRSQDLCYQGTAVEALAYYADQNTISLSSFDRLIVSGSNTMMAAVQEARTTLLKACLNKNHHAIALLNTRMQCMMHGICGQCLQRSIDPVSGQDQAVFACLQSHQDMETIDFKNIFSRSRCH